MGLGSRIRDWYWGFGIGILDKDWELVIGIGDWRFGLGIGRMTNDNDYTLHFVLMRMKFLLFLHFMLELLLCFFVFYFFFYFLFYTEVYHRSEQSILRIH